MLLSIIVPVYNSPRDIAECVGAIRSSAPVDSEIIVVDDGSTDDTAARAAAAGARVLRMDENSGPAAARNCGAHYSSGEVLVFVDADVVLARDALRRIVDRFTSQPDLAAVFGSYDATPGAPGLLSQYRNLLHHFVHQQGDSEAATFWAGCGAIRRGIFEQLEGFDEKRFLRPSIEDIELGYRLRAAGHRILLDRSIQGTHLKRWRFGAMIRTDIFQRALPWSRLILETKHLPNDLNLKSSQRVSFLLVLALGTAVALSIVQPRFLLLAVSAVVGLVVINRNLYLFFFRHKGVLFAASAIALHSLYYLYSGLSYGAAWLAYRIEARAARIPGQKNCCVKPRNFRFYR